MKIDIQIFSAEEIKLGEDAVVNFFVDGKQIPAVYSFVRSGTFLTIGLDNPTFDLELRRKDAGQRKYLWSSRRKGSRSETKKEST
jgi:hypothetical protein